MSLLDDVRFKLRASNPSTYDLGGNRFPPTIRRPEDVEARLRALENAVASLASAVEEIAKRSADT